jgi:RNA polymerase sigma-70 factor (ECF subfamily)
MTKMEAQTQQDELLPSVRVVATAPTDEVLIAAAKSGDHPAFWTMDAALESRIQDGLSDHGNRYDAEDAFPDARMKAYTHLNTLMAGHNSRLGSRESRSIRRS